MGVKQSLKVSLFKKIDGRTILAVWITTLISILRYIDVDKMDLMDWASVFIISGVPVIATLFNIEIPNSTKLLKSLIQVIQNPDLTLEQKMKMIENQLIIAVHEWNKIADEINSKVAENKKNDVDLT